MKTKKVILGMLVVLFTVSSALGQQRHRSTLKPHIVEGVFDTVRAIAIFPSIITGDLMTLRLNLRHASTHRPVPGANAMVHMDYVYTDDDGHRWTISQTFPMEEIGPGAYEHQDRFALAGPLSIAFHVTEVSGTRLTAPIDIAVETEITDELDAGER